MQICIATIVRYFYIVTNAGVDKCLVVYFPLYKIQFIIIWIFIQFVFPKEKVRPSFNFLAWRLRRNHRQGKQKQWYGKDRFHIDAKLVIFTKIECCF